MSETVKITIDDLTATAAELRRLHALNAELVEALRRLIDMDVAYRRGPVVEEAVEKARAALAKVETSK